MFKDVTVVFEIEYDGRISTKEGRKCNGSRTAPPTSTTDDLYQKTGTR
jgi:hypothetical protein